MSGYSSDDVGQVMVVRHPLWDPSQRMSKVGFFDESGNPIPLGGNIGIRIEEPSQVPKLTQNDVNMVNNIFRNQDAYQNPETDNPSLQQFLDRFAISGPFDLPGNTPWRYVMAARIHTGPEDRVAFGLAVMFDQLDVDPLADNQSPILRYPLGAEGSWAPAIDMSPDLFMNVSHARAYFWAFCGENHPDSYSWIGPPIAPEEDLIQRATLAITITQV